MNSFRKFFAGIISFILVFSILTTGQAAETERAPKIRIVSSTNQVNVGDTFEVAIWLQDFTGKYSELEGLQIRLKYDANLILPVGEGNGQFAADAIFPQASNPTTLVNIIDQKGKIELAQFLPPKSETGHFTGYGKVGTVTFKALKEGNATISQEKSIAIMPENPGTNIKHSVNQTTVVIGKGETVAEKIEMIGSEPHTKKKERSQEEILKDFKDYSEIVKIEWSKAGIAKLAESKIVKGMPDGTFNPFKNMTRAEFAKVIVIALGLDMVQKMNPTFNDIQKSDWFYDYVETAAKYGLIKGVEKDGVFFFKPQENITRAEIAAILSRALTSFKGKKEPANLINPFTDVSASYWAKEDISYLQSTGIIKGKSATLFAPNDAASRAEVSVMMARLLDLK